jgi:meiotic recombination protein DMC1
MAVFFFRTQYFRTQCLLCAYLTDILAVVCLSASVVGHDNPEQTLENIIICRVFSHEEQMSAVKPIAALLSDLEQGPFRVLIVDSIIALFRVEFAGRGRLAARSD